MRVSRRVGGLTEQRERMLFSSLKPGSAMEPEGVTLCASCSCCHDRRANSVVRNGSRAIRCPTSRRRFQVHRATICQASCPQSEWRYHRSGSRSWSSSSRAVSKDPRCRESETTSEAVKALWGRWVQKRSEVRPLRRSPIGRFFCFGVGAGCVATRTRSRDPLSDMCRSGQSESARPIPGSALCRC